MDINERNKRVEENLKLVSHSLSLLKVAWSEDYFQQGVLELIRCAENYDETKGYKFSTYATKCIMLKLKDYIKRDYVLKPKLTGEKGGKVYAPPVDSLNDIVFELPGAKPIQLQEVIADKDNFDGVDIRIEMDSLVEKGIVEKDDLDLFIDMAINGYPVKELSKIYHLDSRTIRRKVSVVKEILQDKLSYNYYEGGQ